MPSAEGARVTVVIPSWSSERWLPGCLQALSRQSYRSFSVLVVEGGGAGAAPALPAAPPATLLRLPSNRGFAAAANAGWRASETPYVALLNPDTLPEAGWLEALVQCLDGAGERTGSVASKMLQMERGDRIDDAGDGLTWYGAAFKRGRDAPESAYGERDEVLSACAGAALYRRSMLADLGGFDEAFGSYLEDLDLGLRARLLGWHCLYEPAARVLHQGGGSGLARGAYVRMATANRALLLAKSLPASLARRHWRQLLWGQIYFALAYRRPFASLRGYARALVRLPHVRRERRRLLARRVLSDREIEALLQPGFPEPPLGGLVRRRLSRSA